MFVSYLNDRGHLIWTRGLTVIVATVAVLLGTVAIVFHRALGDNLATDAGALAGVGLLIASSGRMITVHRARWAHVSQPPSMPVRMRRGRVIIRRRDAGSLAILTTTVIGCLAAMCVAAVEGTLLSGDSVLLWGTFGPVVVLLALLSFASYVMVSPAEVVVTSTFSIIVIPRHLVSGVTGTGQGKVQIHVTGHPRVAVPVGTHTRWVRSWDYRAAELKTAGRILSALDVVPTAPSADSGVMTRRRPFVIAVTVLAAAEFLTIVMLIKSGAVGT